MDGHDKLLTAFLAGDLAAEDARQWDEHLLECERCWRAVREDRSGRDAAALLRLPAPLGLADRVAFAVEVAAAAQATGRQQARPGTRPWRRAGPGRRPRRRWLAVAGTLAAALAVTLAVLLLPGGATGSVPAAVGAVARYAEKVLPAAGGPRSRPGGRAAPVEVGGPATLTAGRQRIVVRTWRLGGVYAVVAVSGLPFPMPASAQGISGSGMAWSAQLGKLRLYCLNGRTSELVAAPVPERELAALAARLPRA